MFRHLSFFVPPFIAPVDPFGDAQYKSGQTAEHVILDHHRAADLVGGEDDSNNSYL